MRGVLEIWHLVKRLLSRMSAHKLVDEAAKIAYFSFLSVFPLILILLALAGMVGGEAAFDWVMAQLVLIMPGEAADYLGKFVQDVTGVSRPDVLGISLVFLLISASNAMVAMIGGLNTIFGITEQRPWWRRNLLAVGTTFGGALFLLFGVSWILGGPDLLLRLGMGWVWSAFQWPIVFTVLALIVWLAYRRLPNHRKAPGAVALAIGAMFATLAWAGVTQGLRFYFANFERFASVYGVVTGILILMIWLQLSALTILLGAELAATIDARHEITR
jgi:membrane protein